MTKPIIFLLLATICSTSWAFGVVKDRRAFLQSLSGLAFAAVTPGSAANANPYCAAGVGEDCEDLSEGNEFIKSLQEKSAANREANLKVSQSLRLNTHYVLTLQPMRISSSRTHTFALHRP